mgnify:CR=1 FL=1
MTYQNVFDNVDFSYSVHSSGIKEDIVVYEPLPRYEFSFRINSEGLTLQLRETGEIIASDGNEIIFIIPAPNMTDQNGCYSEAVRYVLGALNLNARNFDVELRRAVEKLENGMSGFLTQPVLSAQAVENLKKARETLGEQAKILAGILPVVSQRNAIFMENEVNGIHVDEAIIQKFEGLDRAAGEELGLEVSVQAAKAAAPYADGFYLMTPFNRVALMERLIARLRTEVTD